MPVDTNSTFIAEKNKATNQPIFLYTLFNYDGLNNNLNYAEYDTDVVYQSVNDSQQITYVAFPITHDQIGENTSSQIDSIKITLANVSRLIQAYLELYDNPSAGITLRGKKVLIRTVWANQLGDNEAFVDHVYYIDSWVADQNNVTFTVSSKFDVLERQLPGRNFSRTACAWATRFKGIECQYTGVEATCDGTLQQCRGYNNVLRYGAQPAVPSQKIYNI